MCLWIGWILEIDGFIFINCFIFGEFFLIGIRIRFVVVSICGVFIILVEIYRIFVYIWWYE